jgi:hypothetical protein
MKCPHCGGALKLAADLEEIEGELCAVLPFPVVQLDASGGLVLPPREYKTIRRPETLAA